LGTFAKPTAGVLDLASGLSAAVRGSATRSSRLYQPKRIRSIRNCFGPGGAIPRFSKTNSEGQSIVLKLNANNMDEKYVKETSLIDPVFLQLNKANFIYTG
jgi:vacuolar protein sorting-associated protein 13D